MVDRKNTSKPDYTLRGKCHEMAAMAATRDPTLRLTRGWYDDPQWGAQEHWWCTAPDGTIVDPTAAQFPMGGVPEWYREFAGRYPCFECGREVPEVLLVSGRFCSLECYGRCVGSW